MHPICGQWGKGSFLLTQAEQPLPHLILQPPYSLKTCVVGSSTSLQNTNSKKNITCDVLKFRRVRLSEGHNPPRGSPRNLPLRGLCGGLSEGSAGVSQRALRGLCGVSPRVLRGSAAGVREIFRGSSGVVTLCLWPWGTVGWCCTCPNYACCWWVCKDLHHCNTRHHFMLPMFCRHLGCFWFWVSAFILSSTLNPKLSANRSLQRKYSDAHRRLGASQMFSPIL